MPVQLDAEASGPSRPLHEEWWFWVAVGLGGTAVVAGGILAAPYLLGDRDASSVTVYADW
jgi:hypothetical protein